MSDRDVDLVGLVNNKSGVEKTGPETKEFPASIIVKAIDQGKRQITALASAATLDRYDEIILPEAFRELLPVYMKNPIVITSHQHRLQTGHSSVVGRTAKASVISEGLLVTIEFAQGTELAEEYWQLYSQKIQKALSIGYMPIESQYEQREGKNILVHTKIELLEISCVAVPANREALTRTQQRKADWLDEKKLLAQMRKEDPDFDKKAEEFGEAILSGEDESGGERIEELNLAEIVGCKTTKDENELVKLVQGR
ncbi:MAG: HK97 family phage prohead protease [Planctomycetota bacterium]|jgi:HK97 family phage prohead protease